MPKSPLHEAIHAKAEGKSFSQAARDLGTTKDAIQKQVKRVQLVLPPQPEFPEEMHLTGDFIVTSDLHVNAVQQELVELVPVYAQKLGIKQLAIVGDLFNFDVFSLYPFLVAAQSMDTEVKAARAVLVYWLQYFDKIYLCRGNHDERLMKFTSGQIDMDSICNLILRAEDGEGLRQRLIPTVYDRMWLSSSSGDWLLCHQKMYSRIKLRVASDLANKYHCNVLTTHEHAAGISLSLDGKYTLVSNPCFCNPDKIAYKKLNTNAMPEWNLGFSIIKDGVANQYVDRAAYGLKL